QVPDAALSVEGAGEALGSRSKLRQVLLNLVKNGAEAAGSGGRVTVRVESSPEAVEVAVADDGPGIPAEARARLFEPFFTTKPSGTGLGLAVSRSIARAHGGDLALRTGDAGGAILAVRLPRVNGRA
ncbi:MAG TPA: ATP-binding protein, partial [Anaeromyxobacteraceae bacterium]|nr:ATP-binding protein [Anaeromyxobacteraceae bacterium]